MLRPAEPASPIPAHLCKLCQSESVELRWGKYSYYFKCLDCEGSTSVTERCGCGEIGNLTH